MTTTAELKSVDLSPQRIRDDLTRDGFTTRTLTGDPEIDLPSLRHVLRRLGEDLHVFQREGFWKPLSTDPDRPPGASGGVGFNGLHIDCVNVTEPPDVVCLYCVRPDPLGGGMNLVARIGGIEHELSAAAVSELSKPQFRDGAAYDLDGVGVDENPFRVLDLRTRRWTWRYTARLLQSVTGSPRDALLEVDRLLGHRMWAVPLRSGQCVFVEQRTTVHGRLPLHGDQHSIAPNERRLLVQAYARLTLRASTC